MRVITFDRTAGSHALAAAGQRERSPHGGSHEPLRGSERRRRVRRHATSRDITALVVVRILLPLAFLAAPFVALAAPFVALAAPFVALAAPFVALAQQPSKVPQIGLLGTDSLAGTASRLEAFRQGLRDLGYVEGRNIAIEYRWADGKVERFPDFAVELVGLKVDVIVATSTPGALAARNAPWSSPRSSSSSSTSRLPRCSA
jgi:hypothetical protein